MVQKYTHIRAVFFYVFIATGLLLPTQTYSYVSTEKEYVKVEGREIDSIKKQSPHLSPSHQTTQHPNKNNKFYMDLFIGPAMAHHTQTSKTNLTPTQQPTNPYQEPQNDTATLWDVEFGYHINKIISAELGYVDFGSRQEKIKTTAKNKQQNPPKTNIALDVDGLTLGAKGKYGLFDKVGLFSKVGAIYWDRKIDTISWDDAVPPNPSSVRSNDFENNLKDEDGFDAYLGLGVRYDVGDDLSIAIDATRYFLNEHVDIVGVRTLFSF